MSRTLTVPARDLTKTGIPTLADIDDRLKGGARACVGLGAILLAAAIVLEPARGWGNLLLTAYNMACVGLGGLFLLAIQSTTGARWSDPILKAHRAMPALLPLAGLLMLLLWVGAPVLYPWARPEATSHPVLLGRLGWMNRPLFFGRLVLVFAVWIWLGRRLVVKGRGAAVFIVAFAVTFSVANFDWLMSLEPSWASTIFAIYGFSGLFLQGIAVVTISAIVLRRVGLLPMVSRAQNHDLGKLLFAFSSFWAYIFFSQFLLIWYGNLPEETGPMRLLLHGRWMPLFYLNLLLNFGLPFVLLLQRKAKTNETILLTVCALLLMGRWLDLYLQIMPPVLQGRSPGFGLGEVGGILLQLGLGHLACWPVFMKNMDPSQEIPREE